VGALVGFAVGSGYAFWATRRNELATAVVATAALAEGLREIAVSEARPGDGGHHATRSQTTLGSTWKEQRPALTVFLPPADFHSLADKIDAADRASVSARDRDRLILSLTGLHTLFWSEHELFILVPLYRTLRRRTALTERASEVLNFEPKL
jgi:hypothetical protein